MPIFDSGYPKNTSPDDADVVLTTDTSDSSVVKGVTLGSIWSWITSKTDWITTAAIQDGAVTANKVDADTFKSVTAVSMTMESGYTNASPGNIYITNNGTMIWGYIAISKDSGNWSTSETHIATIDVPVRDVSLLYFRGAIDMSGSDLGIAFIRGDGELYIQANVARAGSAWFTFCAPIISL